jgi:hypothetical protein
MKTIRFDHIFFPLINNQEKYRENDPQWIESNLCCFFFLCCLNRFSRRWPIWMIDTFMHINTDAQRDNLDMQY